MSPVGTDETLILRTSLIGCSTPRSVSKGLVYSLLQVIYPYLGVFAQVATLPVRDFGSRCNGALPEFKVDVVVVNFAIHDLVRWFRILPGILISTLLAG